MDERVIGQIDQLIESGIGDLSAEAEEEFLAYFQRMKDTGVVDNIALVADKDGTVWVYHMLNTEINFKQYDQRFDLLNPNLDIFREKLEIIVPGAHLIGMYVDPNDHQKLVDRLESSDNHYAFATPAEKR